MKLLIVTMDFPPNIKGGEGVFAFSISKHLSQMGIDVTVVAPISKSSTEYDKDNNLNVVRIKTFGNSFITKTPSFALYSRKLIKKFNGDLILLLRPALVNNKKNIIINFRNTRYGEFLGCKISNHYFLALLNKIYVPFDRYITKKAKRIIVFDKKMKDEVTTFAPHSSSKIVLLPNGIDLEQFKHTIKNDFSIRRLLYIGRLDARKGIDDLIESIKILNRYYHYNLSLCIVGDGPQKGKLTKLIAKHGIGNKVKLHNKAPYHEVDFFYREYDLVVLPSRYEPFGRVTLEAMACGTPVITSDVCADLGQPMFKAGDIDSLVALIISLINNPYRVKKLSKNGINIAKQHSWQNITQHLLHILKDAKNST